MNTPFAATFDLVSSEYGWTDDQILDLTLGRLRQVQTVIRERLTEETEQKLLTWESVVKTIVGAMPGLANSKRAGKSIEKYANKIRFLNRKRELPKTEDLARLFGGE